MAYRPVATVLVLPLLLAFFWASGPSLAEEKKKPTRKEKALWQMAKATFAKYYRHKKPEEREKAAKAIAEAVCPGVHVKAARYLVTMIEEELKRGKEKEEQIHYRIIEACVSGLGKITEEKAVTWLLDQVKSGAKSWRVRFHIIEGLGAKENPKVVEALRAGVKDPDPKIQLASIDALGRLVIKEAREDLYEALDSPLWQVQIAAIHAISKMPVKGKEEKLEVADKLVEALRKVNEKGGRVKWELVQALNKLAGKELGYDVLAWEAWLARQRKGKTAGGRLATMPVVPTYHGVKIWSNRVIFVIDITGSMSDPATNTPEKGPAPVALPLPPVVTGSPAEVKRRQDAEKLKKLKEENDKREVRSKMDAEKRELINAILSLRPKTYFTVIFYSEEPLPWQPKLVPATAENKIAVVKEIEKVGPFGGTDIYKALMAAFAVPGLRGEGESNKPRGRKQAPKLTGDNRPGERLENLKPPADEVFLLTDGDPTVGEMT
ncbi:MAG: HEAT repeat domain-containing protein, partial [Planctomycetota bacterium]